MKIIKDLVDHIKEELEGAQEYAEKYIEAKASGSPRASTYRQMAFDELHHAEKVHEFAVEEIKKISAVMAPPVEMEEKWKHEHKKYVEDFAKIKMILQ